MNKLIVLLLATLLVACSGAAATPTPPPAAEGPAAPAANAPAGTPAAASADRTPVTSGTSGAIRGVLLDDTGKPIPFVGVFLADLLDGPNGSKMLAFQLGSGKRGITNEQGTFILDDIKAGEYSLVVQTPRDSVPIPEPNGAPGSAILVKVEAGSVFEVGSVKVTLPDR